MWPLFFPHSAPKGGPNQNTLGLVDPGELAKTQKMAARLVGFVFFVFVLVLAKPNITHTQRFCWYNSLARVAGNLNL